jgi:hypothetical protein
MKKIKDFKKFESLQDEDEFDYDYVKQCFIDLIESCDIKYIDDDFVVIEFEKLPEPKIEYRNDGASLMKIEDYIKDLQNTRDIMNDINSGIEKVKDEYPNYECVITYDDGMEYGELLRNPQIKVSIHNTHH